VLTGQCKTVFELVFNAFLSCHEYNFDVIRFIFTGSNIIKS